jgi:lysophospholipase L1-like esterase
MSLLRSAFCLLLLGLLAARPALRGETPGAAPAESPDLPVLRARLEKTKEPLTWVITGDSITQGALWLGREKSYPQIFEERIRWELGRRRDFVINTGISGQRAPQVLDDLEWRVLRFKPDVVSVMLGMNDAKNGPDGRAAFEAALREIVRRIRALGAIPILHRTNPTDPVDEAARIRADLPAYNDVIARVAAEEKVILVDHWKHWAEAAPTLEARRAWLADSLHPNPAGHRQLAIEFFKVLGLYDPKSPSCAP